MGRAVKIAEDDTTVTYQMFTDPPDVVDDTMVIPKDDPGAAYSKERPHTARTTSIRLVTKVAIKARQDGTWPERLSNFS
jgi:hypothetical protein